MYGDSLNLQYENLLVSLGAGFIFGAAYDIVRFLRITAAKRKFFLVLLDTVFPVFVGIATYLVSLGINYGIVRFYIAAGELLGFVIYNLTVSKYLFSFIMNVYFSVRNKTKRVLSLILKPLNLIDSKLGQKTDDVGIKLKKRFKKLKFFRKIDLKPCLVMLYNEIKYNFFYRMKGGGRDEGEEKP